MRIPSNIDDMPVAEIMRHWPDTISVFLELRMHCIGCPIGGFHTIREAALEHGLSLDLLEKSILAVIQEGAEDR